MIRILHGDCRTILTTLPDASVQCCVTSPPYFGLRDYGVAGQIGLEASPDAYIAEMVAVFREVRRVLRDDGTLWLNLGDSYASGGRGGGMEGEQGEKQRSNQGALLGPKKAPDGFKPKDLLMMPARVALALQADGWWLRSDIIWAKPNPMPESVTDRPTSAHEHVFLLTKSARYYFDADAVREAAEYGRSEEIGAKIWNRSGVPSEPGRTPGSRTVPGDGGTRNIRNVWTIATAPFPEAHFATFPPELAERCIKAGTSERGCCANCGAPWVRSVEATGGILGKSWADHSQDATKGNAAVFIGQKDRGAPEQAYRRTTTGWLASCQCINDALGRPDIVPCTILDPFAGAFTAPLVADRLQRNAIGIELSPTYCEMARDRLIKDAGMFAEVA